MSPILETSNLTKRYGSLTAVNELNLKIDQGQVFGFLGPNGSGKTSTLGMILGVIQPSGGEYSWFGMGQKHSARLKIGSILENPAFYPYLSASENLKITAAIKKVDKSRIDTVLKEVGLLERKKDKFRTYSLGMKQRLAIASALLSDPEILILDEPTNGLDPQGIVEIREIIQQISSTGKTIILASHLLEEVQKVCTHFAVLKKGKKLHQGSVAEVTKEQPSIEIGAGEMTTLKDALTQLGGVKDIISEGDFYRVMIEPEVTVEYISKSLLERGITPTHLRRSESSLEQQFIKILKEND